MKKQRGWLPFGLIVAAGFALSIGEGLGLDWLSAKLFSKATPEAE